MASLTSVIISEWEAIFPRVIIVLQKPRTPATEILRELSDSRYTVFDVLPAFFVNEDPWVTLGACFWLIVLSN